MNGKDIVAVAMKTEDENATWMIGPFTIPTVDGEVGYGILGQGNKHKVMKDFKTILSNIKKDKMGNN